MSTFNKKEYGQVVRVNLGTDISSGTDLKVVIEPIIGNKKEFTTNIVVGTSNITVDDTKFLADEYLEYTIQPDDLNQSGLWRVRGSALVGGVLIKSDYVSMTVLP